MVWLDAVHSRTTPSPSITYLVPLRYMVFAAVGRSATLLPETRRDGIPKQKQFHHRIILLQSRSIRPAERAAATFLWPSRPHPSSASRRVPHTAISPGVAGSYRAALSTSDLLSRLAAMAAIGAAAGLQHSGPSSNALTLHVQ